MYDKYLGNFTEELFKNVFIFTLTLLNSIKETNVESFQHITLFLFIMILKEKRYKEFF